MAHQQNNLHLIYIFDCRFLLRVKVRGDDSDRKYTVLVGNRAQCSCGVHLCLHHLFVMLKVHGLRVGEQGDIQFKQ